MKPLSKITLLIISFIIFSFTVKQSFAQQTEDEQRAHRIFTIAQGVTWENEDTITTYTIGVFSSETLFDELQKSAKTETIKGKPVKIIRYLNYADIQANQIVYVSRKENAYLGFVYKKFKGKNVLIVSEQSRQPEYSILNFRKIDPKDPKPFDINSKLAELNHIILSKQLIRVGGNRQDIRIMYAATNKKFKDEQKKLDEKRSEIDSLKLRILFLEKKIKDLENK
ncbi:MAG: YfiR family protein [Bacteroidales bacterium]|nr:YfiR family protein [Bacteroidales bacterium]